MNGEYFQIELCRGEHMLAKPTEIFLCCDILKTQHELWTTKSDDVPTRLVNN